MTRRQLLHWLRQSVRNARPNTPIGELAATMAARLQEMADGDATAQARMEADAKRAGDALHRAAADLGSWRTSQADYRPKVSTTS